MSRPGGSAGAWTIRLPCARAGLTTDTRATRARATRSIARPIPAADVEHESAGAGSLPREQVGRHDVVDVGEVAGLRPVTVNFERVAGERPHDEARNDDGVLGGRILSRAEDVEVTEPDGLD